MNSKHVIRKSAVLVRQQREICIQMNRHFDEDVCRAVHGRGSE